MYYRFDVTRTHGPLAQETWTFVYFWEKNTIVLDTYRKSSRPSTRHKMKVDAEYVRLGRADAQEAVREADVPLPEDIMMSARVALTAHVRVASVLKWSEYK